MSAPLGTLCLDNRGCRIKAAAGKGLSPPQGPLDVGICAGGGSPVSCPCWAARAVPAIHSTPSPPLLTAKIKINILNAFTSPAKQRLPVFTMPLIPACSVITGSRRPGQCESPPCTSLGNLALEKQGQSPSCVLAPTGHFLMLPRVGKHRGRVSISVFSLCFRSQRAGAAQGSWVQNTPHEVCSYSQAPGLGMGWGDAGSPSVCGAWGEGKGDQSQLFSSTC